MCKKVLSVLCALALALGLLPASTLSVGAAQTPGAYQVGFARVDINPYVVEDDPTSGIMALPLGGTGDTWDRLSTYGLLDDNGDGIVDENDGLKVTCIAISDEDGKTILLITGDFMGVYKTTNIRNAIIGRVDAAIASGELTGILPLEPEQIYYAGTHTHSSPASSAYVSGGKTGTNAAGVDLSVVNENLGIWIDRTIEDVADAAMLALKDRAPAQLTKDQLSVSKATSPVLHDKRLNSTRLYRTDVDGDEFVSGDNFNSVYKKYYADPNDYETSRGINPKQVAPVNDTMYLLKFDFGSSDKLPIILTNWRGHVTTVNRDKVPGSTRYAVSSDYVNAYRHALEYGCEVSFDPVNGYITDWTIGSTQKYRVAFFNDTGGSVNTGGFEKIIYHGSEGEVEQRANSWLKESVNTSRLKNKTGSYGTVLATLAQECLNDGLNEIPVSNGKIKTSKVDYYGEVKTTGITALAYAAAKACREAAAVKTVTYPYKYTDPETGEMFAVGSSFHADKIIGSWDSKIGAPETGIKKLTLTSFLLSREVAFLSIPGEPFDFLVKDITVTGEARTAPENNLWNSLIHEDTYGRPFVLGYCNGYQSYFPSYDAYVYNQGSTRWAVGSYEAHQARYQQGTAETVVRIYDKMLRDLAEGSGDLTYTGYCAHCGENQLWQPYNNETTLTLKSPTLEFKDMITVNAMFTAENIENVVEMGMITYKEKVEVVSVDTADHVIPGTAYDVNTGRYIAHSQGIHAKYLGDTVYLACYPKLTDGSYVYTKLAPYSPVQYATSQLKNATDVKLKKLVAAMLNYGTEAQLFFGHSVGVPANGSLTADQRALPDLYRADMAGAVPNASTGKQGFSKRYPAISFEGAFCINYFFKPNHTPVGDITLYYWNEADFAAADVLTAENSSGSMTLEPEDGGEYRGDIVGISAKNLSEAVYVAAVYSDGTTTWSSGVLGYSIGSYCSGQSAKGAEVAALAEATAVYGYHAKQYFG